MNSTDLQWTKTGDRYPVYTASGTRADFVIRLDRETDRYIVCVENLRCVDRIYYLDNATLLVAIFEREGTFRVPPPEHLKQPKGGEQLRVLVVDGGLTPDERERG